MNQDILRTKMRSDVVSKIIKPHINSKIKQLTERLKENYKHSGGGISDVSVKSLDGNYSVQIEGYINPKKLKEFNDGADQTVKGTFKYKSWSSMEI